MYADEMYIQQHLSRTYRTLQIAPSHVRKLIIQSWWILIPLDSPRTQQYMFISSGCICHIRWGIGGTGASEGRTVRTWNQWTAFFPRDLASAFSLCHCTTVMLGFASISNQCLVSDSPEPSLPVTLRKFTLWCWTVPLSLSYTVSQVDSSP
jgi:hypothetical protein